MKNEKFLIPLKITDREDRLQVKEYPNGNKKFRFRKKCVSLYSLGTRVRIKFLGETAKVHHDNH